MPTDPTPLTAPFRPGDRVLLRTPAGDLAATVRDARRQPDGQLFYLAEVDGGWNPPRRVVHHSQVRPVPPGYTPRAPGAAPGPAPGFRRAWGPAELALLGTDHDAAVAARIGRTAKAVTKKRTKLQIPVFRDRRRRKPHAAG